MIVKIANLFVAGSLSLCALSAPAYSAELRSATKAEIVKHLGPNAAGKTNANGFTYKEGSSKGYKVSNGSICIRSPNGSTGCAKILTDGTNFKMLTADGARGNF
ncbi:MULTISPECIES: hypothetical protein [Rhizobium]|uniref:Uncharacterized protein n=1 Tax=Rhizobium rhododendri TaxID=2506430 RepID=A0ABY8IG19_9HYPH|nr:MULTISPECIES: hypothetical protein [Rhizobium]MBO9096658.1 hypothetical protein [Rhizobium sp. L58/93]MBO9136416.1 hypothetical protein [Rhizobium sp. B209b/85]MBO9166914.1 hypothetical protein [Rhizobium sp. L245/93]MBO9182886.1 hypothetical protein [Rhizobium sp. E27B/91]MBZ5763013.1 hypothetical protein [Rhizobium sp. VS19-DR96]